MYTFEKTVCMMNIYLLMIRIDATMYHNPSPPQPPPTKTWCTNGGFCIGEEGGNGDRDRDREWGEGKG